MSVHRSGSGGLKKQLALFLPSESFVLFELRRIEFMIESASSSSLLYVSEDVLSLVNGSSLGLSIVDGISPEPRLFGKAVGISELL